MNRFLLATATLTQREVVRFLRQRSRIIGALGTPLLFWLLLGSGFGRSFSSGLSYLQYFFPGTLVMVLLFTSIFSTISIIEDRREGFLQGVLVAPIPRSSLVMGKLLGGTLLATLQGLLFLLLSPLLGIRMNGAEWLMVLAAIFFMSFALTGLGFVIAWRLDSTQGFHSVMNLFLMPLWFLSGAVFPLTGAPSWLKGVMMVNPLTYSVALLHHGFFDRPARGFPSIGAGIIVTIVFALLMCVLSILAANRTEKSSKLK